jgi:uncharacterized protein (TIGR03437 family)
MPLQFTSDGQVNAIVPHGINIDTRQQVLIRRGNTYSRPVSVDVAAAQPAVFPASHPEASRQGHIYRVGESGNLSLAAPGSPAAPGEAIILYCAGLGDVNPPVAAGSPGPAQEPLSRTVQPVSVTIGGVDAQIVYSGLAPGYAGVYQVNAVVPEGAAAGPAVPVTLRIAGQQSPMATMAVR